MKYLTSLCVAATLLSGCGQRDEPETAAAPPAATDVTPQTEPPTEASAQLAPTQGNAATGSLVLTAAQNGVHLSGSVQGLAPNGEFGFHIHEKGDCSAPDANSAGEHFNPTNAQHGGPTSDAHHAGDMHNVKSDAQGTAQIEVDATGVSLGSGQPDDVLGRAVVTHAKPDDYTTQPSGNSGARIACGVITRSSAMSP
jgi:superoxide dismutase, Cu-Zn family